MNRYDEIASFLEQEIVPRYDAFDAGHRRDHVHYVMRECQQLAQYYPTVDRALLLVAAAYHDLGLEVGRKVHHTESARIIREDQRLSQWFTTGEIEIIAQAAEDHRASSDHEPRSIYGRLVAESDRQIDGDTIIRRTIQFTFKHHNTFDREENYKRLLEHMAEKYAEGGYLKLWIPESSNAKRLEEFRQLLKDPSALRDKFDKIFDTLINDIIMTTIIKPGIPVALCSDHAGFATKQAVISYLKENNIEYKDFGTYNEDSCDYPDFAHPCALAIENGECYPGIAICGSGEGINITLNKHQGIRSALCWQPELASLARQHNDANVLAMPGRFVTNDEAIEMVKTFLSTPFEGGRHQNRVNKIPVTP
jgi:RpiB/LacA/LacB family sugar-phosphate isomerase